MTLQELSSKTGLSVGYLSQVERGLADCSVSVLRRIASGLEVHVLNFFDRDFGEQMVVRKNERKVFGKKNNDVVYELLTPDTQRKMQVTLVEFPPRYKEENVSLKHDSEEWIMVVSGKIKFGLGDTEHVLEKGDAIYFSGIDGYHMENPTDEKCQLIGVITPPVL